MKRVSNKFSWNLFSLTFFFLFSYEYNSPLCALIRTYVHTYEGFNNFANRITLYILETKLSVTSYVLYNILISLVYIERFCWTDPACFKRIDLIFILYFIHVRRNNRWSFFLYSCLCIISCATFILHLFVCFLFFYYISIPFSIWHSLFSYTLSLELFIIPSVQTIRICMKQIF